MRTVLSVLNYIRVQTYFNFSRWETESLFSKESKIID